MKRNISFSGFIIAFFLLSMQVHGQVAYLKQNDVINGRIGDGMSNAQPQNLRYKDNSLLKKGRYILERDEKNIKMSFYINTLGQIDGEVSMTGLAPSWDVKSIFRNDTLIKYDALRSGIPIKSGYLDKGIFYKKEYNEQGELKNEYRYKNGEQIYSKSMNFSGWDIKDDINGIREFYYDQSNIIRSRTTSKGLDKGITSMREEFDEQGKLKTKIIQYEDGKEKTIRQDGSYKIFIPSTKSDHFIYEYSSKGKLLRKDKVIYPGF